MIKKYVKGLVVLGLLVCYGCGGQQEDNGQQTNVQNNVSSGIIQETGTVTQNEEINFSQMNAISDEVVDGIHCQEWSLTQDNINVVLKAKDTKSGTVTINDTVLDVSPECDYLGYYLHRVYMAFADVNFDGKNDVILKMNAFSGRIVSAVFVSMGESYSKVSAVASAVKIDDIKIEIQDNGKFQCSNTACGFDEVIDMTEAFKTHLSTAGLYKDGKYVGGKTVTYRYDDYEQKYEIKNGALHMSRERVVMYDSISVGVAYKEEYKLSGNTWVETGKSMYPSKAQTR